MTTTDASQLVQTRFDTPLGEMRAIASDAGVMICDFLDRREIDETLARVERQHGPVAAGDNEHLAQLKSQLAAYFDRSLRTFTVALIPNGSAFDVRMWEYLRSIPYGQTRTYGQQAKETGDINAVRAVGGANGRNFIAIVIPCHRVIGANGHLTGFGGGIERKRWLLDHEAGGLFETNHTHAMKTA